MAYKTRHLIFLSCSLSFFSSSAYAYLDPGSVSLVLQSVVAAIAGVVLFWKYWFYLLVPGQTRLSHVTEDAARLGGIQEADV